mmetsp:Transcript_86897/g.150363  ORF Transcript_86897/g.150363 Transcript_86897/m.150363 type:complete len:217 (-) Transcript_86897:1280-1930(-)
MHVTKPLGGRHGSELDASIKRILGVLKVKICRSAIRLQTCSVCSESLIDSADLRCNLLETIHETLFSGLAHCLKLCLHLFNVLPGDVCLVRGCLNVLHHALHLVNGLQVWTEALELHMEPLELRSVFLFQHLCGWPKRGSFLLFGQGRVIYHELFRRSVRWSLCWSTGRLAGCFCQILQSFEATLKQWDFYVLKDSLANEINASIAQGLMLRAEVT